MKLPSCVLLFLLAAVRCGFGQTDDGILGVGKWSEPVADREHTLRGRLVVYDDRAQSAANHARIYLELQHVFQGGWDNAIEIEYDLGSDKHMLRFELRDRRGRTIPPSTDHATRGPMPYACVVTLPCDSTLRLRADTYTLGPETKPEGLMVGNEDRLWIVPSRRKSIFLSGTFTPPKGKPSPLDYYHWQGTLTLPPVKIPVR